VRLLVIALSLVAACSEYEFDFSECVQSLEESRTTNDLPPAWPEAEDGAPAPGGPTLVRAEIEYVGGGDFPGCREPILVRVTGTDLDGDVTPRALAAEPEIYPLSQVNYFEASIVPRDGPATIVLDGASFHAEFPMCVEKLDRYRVAMYVHVRDSAGQGSNAVCARVFARSGVAPPPEQGDGP
jgi:hypothetical protein